jgi:hypothetical protein
LSRRDSRLQSGLALFPCQPLPGKYHLLLKHHYRFPGGRKTTIFSRIMGVSMNALLLLLGRAAGLGGILLCVVAGAARLSGQYYMGNYQLTTLLQAGIAAVVMGCFFLLLALTARERKD